MTSLCKATKLFFIMSSQSLMIVSLTSSSINLCLNLSVETETLVVDAINSSFDILGNVSLTAFKASTQAVRSSLVAARKCKLFVPVNIVKCLPSDMLCPIEETCRKKGAQNLHK